MNENAASLPSRPERPNPMQEIFNRASQRLAAFDLLPKAVRETCEPLERTLSNIAEIARAVLDGRGPEAPEKRVSPQGVDPQGTERSAAPLPEAAIVPDFMERLRHLLNTASAENPSNTPDFILAQYLAGCLAAFNVAVQQRETWYGRDARPSGVRVGAAGDDGPQDNLFRAAEAVLRDHDERRAAWPGTEQQPNRVEVMDALRRAVNTIWASRPPTESP